MSVTAATASEERFAQATQLQLTWWRFCRHRLALISLGVVAFFYLIVIFADFLAIADPHATDARRSFIPPQGISLFDDGAWRPHVSGLKGVRDPKTFKLAYAPDPTRKVPVQMFVRGYAYNLFGLIPTDLHLFGTEKGQAVDGIFLMGTDQLGRDLFSRLVVATRISLSIGLAGVAFSLMLGILLAFVSIVFVAYYTATLTANLTVEKFDSQISGPSDLFGKRVCTVDRTTSATFLTEQGITFTGAPAIKDCYAGIKGNTFDAVVFDAPVLAYFVAHDGAGEASLVGTVFKNTDYGIAFHNGSELRKQADEALLKMREDGDFDMIKEKWFGPEV